MPQKRTLSDAQIEANRRNAQKSTGPRTAAGKNTASRNAIIHGLRANKHIILDEDPQDFLDLLEDCYATHAPVGLAEDRIVLRIAYDSWRRDRTYGIEEGIYRDSLDDVVAADFAANRELVNHRINHEVRPKEVPPPPAPPSERDRAARAYITDANRTNVLGLLARYQAALDRSIDRSIKILAKFQAARKRNNPETTAEILPNGPETVPQQPSETRTTPVTARNCQTKPNGADIVDATPIEIHRTPPKERAFDTNEPAGSAETQPERRF